MLKLKKRVLLLAFQFVILSISGQTLTGIVLEAENKKPISGVKVGVEDTGIWTVTDNSGAFQINYNINETLVFSRAGLIEEKRSYVTIPENSITVEMQIASIRIKEVMLSAKKKNYSEIEIKEEALKNIQAFSLNEVLEQIPGQKQHNLNLNEFKPIVFRSVTPENFSGNGNEGFGNKSFGTAVVVDGIPLSNNENMQGYRGNYSPIAGTVSNEGSVFSPNTIGFGAQGGYFSNANFGVDLREIPVENIESVEVVQGIPSAKYGDLTSGLVNIQQKSGKTPYRAYIALREGTQEYNINKGLQVSKLGFLNVNLNYLSSNSDPRTKFNRYQRVSTSVIWTVYNKNKSISNSLSVDYGSNFDNANFEEEDVRETLTQNKKRDFRISNRFNWGFKNSFFDNLNVNANYTQAYQNSYESKIVSSGGDVVGTSTTEGVYVGAYTPINYRQEMKVEGKPISMFLSADLRKNLKTKSNWIHNFLIGISVRSSDNRGAGRLGNPETLNSIFAQGNGQAFRPYNFGQNVRAEYQFSLYAEDNIFKKIGNSTFNVNAGVRYDNQFGASVLQPRINTYLIYKNFKFRGGFGIASKAPSMNMIYTGARYYDQILADVRLPGYYNIGVVQTFIDYADNLGLKPSKSLRSEVGIDYKFPFGTIGLTAYYNNLYDGFTNENFASKRQQAELKFNYYGTNVPTYDIIGYSNVYYLQNKIVNNLKSKDKGFELMMSLYKLPVKNISLDINGAYVETRNNSNTDKYFLPKTYTDGAVFGIYRPFESKYRQMNVGASLNYHLPKAGLVISLRTQHFLIDDKIIFNPKILYAYINRDLEEIMLTQDQVNDPNQFSSIKETGVDEENQKLGKVFHNFNLKISKHFQNGFRFSFYANNFLDLKQTQTTYNNGKYVTTLNLDLLRLSFGAKIEYQF